MTNKEYRIAREAAESADELYTFESYNGYSFYPNRYMKPDDLKEMRKEYKTEKECNNAFALEGFGGRALVYKTNNGYILRSYYTDVCSIENGEFIRTWEGYSNTTLKHVNIFRAFAGFPALSKREWIEMECK